MKNILAILLLVLLTCTTSFGQKFGYVDSEFVLSKMPAYANAQKELDRLSTNWQKEIETMYKDIEKMYKNYQAEEVLLTEKMKKERQDAIVTKEQEVKEYQKKIFGFEGQLFKKRQELVKPVQDKVFEAVEKVAKAKSLQVIFDKSGDLVMIYTNPIHDYTDYVLEELGLQPATKTSGKPGQSTSPEVNPTPPAGRTTEAGTSDQGTSPATKQAPNPTTRPGATPRKK